MERVRLGRTGVEVPRIAVGTWGFSGPATAGKVPVGWTGGEDEAASAALVRAYEKGLTHWDTADVYGDGHAEAIIGRLWDRVDREQIFLASKVGWDPGPHRGFYHPQQIRQQLDRSLRLLDTDRIDLYYLHHCDFGRDDARLDGAVELLQRVRDEGKIRFIGLSDWSSEKVVRFADRVAPEVVQVYRNVLEDSWESSGLRAWVEEHDAGVAFFSPLQHGLLLGRYERPTTFGDGDHRNRNPRFRDQAFLDHVRACRRRVEERFAGHPEPVLHALVDLLLTDAPTGCGLVGLRRPTHVEAAAALGNALSPEEAAWVRDLYRG